MAKIELKKFPTLAIVATLVSLVASVLAISISLMAYEYEGGVVFLGLLEIVAAVLILAGLTTGRAVLLKVISIIISISLVVTTFVLAIVKYNDHDVFLFSTSLLMLIASVLELVYFVSLRKPNVQKLYTISSLSFGGLTAVYLIIYVSFDIFKTVKNGVMLHPYYYALIVGFMLVALLPFLVQRSLKQNEEISQNENAANEVDNIN